MWVGDQVKSPGTRGAAFNLPVRQLPSAEIDHALARLRVALLEEEVGEFVAASVKGDLAGVADALADIVYVVYGTALTYGIDLDAVLREVHRSNMSKLGSDGKPLIREDGKVLKSEKHFPRHRIGPRPASSLSVDQPRLPATAQRITAPRSATHSTASWNIAARCSVLRTWARLFVDPLLRCLAVIGSRPGSPGAVELAGEPAQLNGHGSGVSRADERARE